MQRLCEPVEAVANGLARNMLGRVGDRRRVKHPRRALADVAIDLARFDRSLGAEHGPEFRALRDIARPLDPPHQVREFLILREYQSYIARPRGSAVGCERFAGGGALQHHGLVVVGHRGRCGKHGPTAHRVALQPDVVLVDHFEAAQMGQTIRTAKAICERRRIAVAVTSLIKRQHHVTAAGKFDRKAVLRLA